MSETGWTPRLVVRIDLQLEGSVRPAMGEIESLIETYLVAEQKLAAAIDAAGGTVRLPDGRAVTTGRGEYNAALGNQRRRAWVLIRENEPMPLRR